ncbi:unnamed protein product [Aspergillus oryzae]|uniref:Unnamed protein product n=2 Tax=Aspergillus oryzae TaxID=5062 RepID=A0AAN4YP79_ASPOZ|nr:unnamed protein product [Aspergillus oryzae]GMF91795.1 unnamed protein product [Aspergillus oryzae]GMG31972.1 unnamed protein product [Aspergillus oryzae]GMG54737.1 unnamed protein product [Aspergillus oryzae var. brunneus]
MFYFDWSLAVVGWTNVSPVYKWWLVHCLFSPQHCPGDDTSAREGDDPAHVDPGNHSPVDRSPGTVAKTNTNCRAGDTLGGGDGKLCRHEMLASGDWGGFKR